MAKYIRVAGIQVHPTLYNTVAKEIAPGTGVSTDAFWKATARLIKDFGPRNEALLRKRDSIQAQIDAWHLNNSGKPHDPIAYAAFLAQIGYLVPEGPAFKVETSNVDDEIACTPGPQLVVPVDNARYALNAANARWGSLLDAYYGTDAGPPETDGATKGGAYNPVRGAKVFEYTHAFLDKHFALSGGAKYGQVTEYTIGSNKALSCKLSSGGVATLAVPSKFVGFNKASDGSLSSVLLVNNKLHVEIVIDRASAVGKTHQAGVKDVLIESAITAIADCEDSVAAVDAEDKSVVYRNWTGLMKGTLAEKFTKGGKQLTRKLREDKTFTSAADGSAMTLPGRVVLLVRNVGLHMYTDMVKTDTGRLVPEGLVDLMVTTLAALHDLSPKSAKPANLRNSRTGSMYIVKPKQHGPEEVAFTVETFGRAEQEFGLKPNTLKIGIMDEERRTTVNLGECIRAAKYRCIFINTGFLDRTGDEIHTSFYQGPVGSKADIKKAVWRKAYEDWNVDLGLETGLLGLGQIGKGMWAAPDNMAEMVKTKGEHPKSGATTAWVPSPTAATLHVLHYHETNVLDVQKGMLAKGRRAVVGDILTAPIMTPAEVSKLTEAQIIHEVENNAQGILGYIVRWIELGVGCSKVPDIDDVGLMEDRATLRIASQHIANWLHHGIVSEEQVMDVLKRMAVVVDRQNAGQAGYRPMSPEFNNNGFKCAVEMIFAGLSAPNGLTEFTLTKYRRMEKELLSSAKLRSSKRSSLSLLARRSRSPADEQQSQSSPQSTGQATAPAPPPQQRNSLSTAQSLIDSVTGMFTSWRA